MKGIIMKRLIISVILIFLAMAAVAQENQKIGLVTFANSQPLKNNDTVHQKYIRFTITNELKTILDRKYSEVALLNSSIDNDLLNRFLGIYSFDEDEIAKVAREENCDAFYVVYFIYHKKMGQVNELNYYKTCSVHTYFFSADGKQHKDQYREYSWRKFNEMLKNPAAQYENTMLKEKYYSFLSKIAKSTLEE